MTNTSRRGFLGWIFGAFAALAVSRVTYSKTPTSTVPVRVPTLPAHSADNCYTLSFHYKRPGDTAWQFYRESLTRGEGLSFLTASKNEGQLSRILERLDHTVDDFLSVGAGTVHNDKLSLNYLSMNPQAFAGSRVAEGVSISAEEIVDRSFLLCGIALTKNFPETLTEEGDAVRTLTTNYAVPTPPPSFKNFDALNLRPGCWFSTPNIPPPVYAEFKAIADTCRQEKANGEI